MTVIPRQEVVTTAAMIERLQKEAARKARNAVKAWIKKHPDWEAADLRKVVIAIVQSVVAEYGSAASSLACDLYDGIMMENGFPAAEPWDGSSDDAIERAVRYQLRKALDGDEAGFLDAVDEMTGYHVRSHANNTTIANCERDNRAYASGGMSDSGQLHQAVDRWAWSSGKQNALPARSKRRRRYPNALEIGDPAFARVPTGMETCTYCLMLASRGFAYHSAKSAGHADHRGCNCMIVPGRHGDSVQGVDESALYDCWRELEALEAYAKQNPDEFGGDDTARRKELESRKKAIVEGYGDSIVLDTSPGAVRKMASTLERHQGYTYGGWYEPRSKMAANYTP